MVRELIAFLKKIDKNICVKGPPFKRWSQTHPIRERYCIIIFIRFNPDDYINQEGVLVKSCWKVNKLGVMQIVRSKQKEWEERIENLNEQIHYWINNPTEKTIEIVELFY